MHSLAGIVSVKLSDIGIEKIRNRPIINFKSDELGLRIVRVPTFGSGSV